MQAVQVVVLTPGCSGGGGCLQVVVVVEVLVLLVVWLCVPERAVQLSRTAATLSTPPPARSLWLNQTPPAPAAGPG